MFAEISKEAFQAIAGKNPTAISTETEELARITDYVEKEVFLREIHNFVSGVVQYYVRDINA